MKAHYNKVSKSFRKEIRAKVEEEFKEQSNNMTRRIMKIFCIALNREFGFGKDRLMRPIAKVEEIGNERDQDEVFWAHVDRIVNEEIGMVWDEEDYDRMDM